MSKATRRRIVIG
ncbi:hypothetical protein Pint_26715 [Pistacia integerrima]|uniref:Uncharacterized protein n=1 Tax=Pistacia integerrima TaxID=434235 RepID=A0ACC0YPE8_9ROSI|nr:hypothetical protein Pint_26715 [Pistacia integerrima]